MRWIAPPERNESNGALEQRLWAAADQLRANSGLTSQQYSQPVLGLIFLRFADARFTALRRKLEGQGKSSRRGSRLDDPRAYNAEGVIYLPPEARYAHLLSLPEGSEVGKALNEAMRAIERDNEPLTEVLPKSYQIFDGKLLKDLLKKFSEIPADLDYDAFGRIYEYFLGEFARTEGSKGGEFYTPSSIVRLMVEVLEPYHGKILDPACGSGGMFVQSARFVAAHRKNPSAELSIHGQEKVGETARLCRMNLAMHGLEGDIKEANSYYEEEHRSIAAFDFVLANPPFNVNAVDKERLTREVGEGKRYPFGLPRADNANYLWIQLFYSALNQKGRAGFVMANSASDAGHSEKEIRRKLIESRVADVMIAVGPNMFYTVVLPCTLWFLDRRKLGTPREDKVLFLDARHVYRQMDRSHRDWTAGQIGFLANIVRLYRGEEPDYTLGGEDTRAKIEELFGGIASYKDVAGLCRVAMAHDIEARDWSLSPGQYVGVARGEDISDDDFKRKLRVLNDELVILSAQTREYEDVIASNVAGLLKSD
jgi:type I restriction enzyme M protein